MRFIPFWHAHVTMAEMKLGVFKLYPYAYVLTRGSDGAAGYDLVAITDTCIPAGARILVSTGIAIVIPPGHYARIASRSSMALKGVDACAGVVDEDYRGEVRVLLHNVGGRDYMVKRGDRIAQLILERCSTPNVEILEELPTTERGTGGFGSTGV